MTSRKITGDIFNKFGMVYEPTEELEVIYLFAKLSDKLKFRVLKIQSKHFPDCEAQMKTNKGKWEDKTIEFEIHSSDFKNHLEAIRNGTRCDFIVCWEDDWKNPPKEIEDIEIIELRNVVGNKPEEYIEPTEAYFKKERHPVRGGIQTKDYYTVILDILTKKEGKAQTKVVLSEIYRIMKPYFNAIDLGQLKYAGDVRWKYKAMWARKQMVDEGLLKSDSERGIWEITTKGKEYLKKNKHKHEKRA